GQVHGAFVDEGAEVGERGRADGRGGEQAGVDQAVVAGTEVAAAAGHPGADVVELVVAVGQADRADDRVAVVVDRRRAAADHQCVTTGADDLAVDVDGAPQERVQAHAALHRVAGAHVQQDRTGGGRGVDRPGLRRTHVAGGTDGDVAGFGHGRDRHGG